eukprot:4415411-Heterocapsa_arctica.AAC.1
MALRLVSEWSRRSSAVQGEWDLLVRDVVGDGRWKRLVAPEDPERAEKSVLSGRRFFATLAAVMACPILS